MSPTLRATLEPGWFQFSRMVLVPGFMPNYAFYLSNIRWPKTDVKSGDWRWQDCRACIRIWKQMSAVPDCFGLFFSNTKTDFFFLLFIVRTEAPSCRTTNPVASGPWQLSRLYIHLGLGNKAIRVFLAINIVKRVRNRSSGGSTLGKAVRVKLFSLMSSNKIKVLN